jgi:hypothetical protein
MVYNSRKLEQCRNQQHNASRNSEGMAQKVTRLAGSSFMGDFLVAVKQLCFDISPGTKISQKMFNPYRMLS